MSTGPVPSTRIRSSGVLVTPSASPPTLKSVLAWLLIALAIAMHVGSVLQRGGLPLARSMASLQLRSGDLPGNWLDQIRRSLKIGR